MKIRFHPHSYWRAASSFFRGLPDQVTGFAPHIDGLARPVGVSLRLKLSVVQRRPHAMGRGRHVQLADAGGPQRV